MPDVIVAFTPNHIGDVLFAEPAITALKCGYNNARLIILTSPEGKTVLGNHPAIGEILVRQRNLIGWLQATQSLRKRTPKLAVSFSPSSFGLALCAYLSGARKRFGFAFRPLLSLLFTTKLRFNPQHHVVEDCLALAEAAGGKMVRRVPQVFLQFDELEWGRQWLQTHGWDGTTPLLGCHPFSSSALKEWKLSNFAELLRWVRVSLGWLPIIFGSAANQLAAQQLAAEILAVEGTQPTMNGILMAAGKLTLRQFLAVVSWCNGFIGGDSGPTHLAAALGVPTLALFGPTDPKRTGPLGKKTLVVRSPTGRMDDLSVITVQEAMREFFTSSRAKMG